MNETVLSGADQSDALAASKATLTNNVTAGVLIRKAREANGLDITTLADTLKVPVKKLEALESDCFEELPDMVFVRALSASVCRTLKIDHTAVLAALPPSTKPQIKTDESGLNTVFEYADGSWLLAVWSQFKSPHGLAIAAVFLGILVVFLAPIGLPMQDKVDSAAAGVLSPVNVSSDVVASPATDVPSAASGVSLPSPGVSVDAVQSASLVPISVPSKEIQSTGSVATLSMNAAGSSWVEVVDAAGVTQLRRTLQPNEAVSLSGLAPLKVVVGRADLVVASANGQTIDLSAVSKDNVARFEVNR